MGRRSARPVTSHAGLSGSQNPMFRMDATSTNLRAGALAHQNGAANRRRPNTAPDRKQQMQQQQQDGGTASPNKDDLRRENNLLRVQVERMRAQSFNAVRGGKRFVSGGGFRAARNTGNTDLGGNVRSSKRGLEHLRNQVRQLTSDKQHLAQQLADANMRLNRCIQNQKALFNQVKVCLPLPSFFFSIYVGPSDFVVVVVVVVVVDLFLLARLFAVCRFRS